MGLRAGLWLLLLAAPFYLWGLGGVGFQDPDEGMYAEIAREMLASRDWVVPTSNGVPYIEKPPLMYWLTAGSLAFPCPSEIAARLWRVLPMLGAVALIGALGGAAVFETDGHRRCGHPSDDFGDVPLQPPCPNGSAPSAEYHGVRLRDRPCG
jgi:4-amino-4-deoxy-L-arabinose transferase-like glycosyltransferase